LDSALKLAEVLEIMDANEQLLGDDPNNAHVKLLVDVIVMGISMAILFGVMAFAVWISSRNSRLHHEAEIWYLISAVSIGFPLTLFLLKQFRARRRRG
jgi:hypothetical protein